MRLYQSLVASGLIIGASLGLAGCKEDSSTNQGQKPALEQILHDQESGLIRGNGINPPHYVNVESRAGYKVGRKTTLTVGALDNIGITSATLYEDGKVVKTWDEFTAMGWLDVEKSQAGNHTYQFEVTDEDGNVVRSESVRIEFSGVSDDRVPYVVSVESRFGNRVGRRTTLTANALDVGDNAGFSKATLYEDGKVVKTWDEFTAMGWLDVEKKQSGTHTYQFEVTDNGGNTVRSELLTVSFNL